MQIVLCYFKTVIFCIGNRMISSAIWDKQVRVNFSKANNL